VWDTYDPWSGKRFAATPVCFPAHPFNSKPTIPPDTPPFAPVKHSMTAKVILATSASDALGNAFESNVTEFWGSSVLSCKLCRSARELSSESMES
jgi:hypothetical protein